MFGQDGVEDREEVGVGGEGLRGGREGGGGADGEGW